MFSDLRIDEIYLRQTPSGKMTVRGGGDSVEVNLNQIEYDRRTGAPDGNRIIARTQPTECLCWATSALIVMGWRGIPTVTTELQVAELADGAIPPVVLFTDAYTRSAAPQCSLNSGGLPRSLRDAFVSRLGMPRKISGLQSRITPCEIKGLLASRGPALVVLNEFPILHVVVVVGVDGDGTNAGTYIHYVDPFTGKIERVSYVHFVVDSGSSQWVQF